eukprot:10349285-Heterocapsa_arctica.AAC.1
MMRVSPATSKDLSRPRGFSIKPNIRKSSVLRGVIFEPAEAAESCRDASPLVPMREPSPEVPVWEP